jgi:hypothetical protein
MLLKHPVTKIVFLFVVFFGLMVGASVGKYVIDHPGDSIQQNVAAWARNNDLGVVVDKLEEWTKGDPPSKAAAEELALVVTEDSESSSTTLPAASQTTSPTTVVPTPSNGVINNRTRPKSITPIVLPALDGEGTWVKFSELENAPLSFATSFRPFADFPSVIATALVIDQSRLFTGLFKGNELPGGSWNNGSRVMKAAMPSLVLTFNGGFRFEHYQGGYFTEGKTLRELRENEATLAIDKNGRATIGVFGRDIFDDGTWTTLRQNLPPIIMDGKISLDQFRSTHWGNDFGKVIYSYRSGACLRHDGRLAFAVAGDVDIDMLAEVMNMLDCKTAMQLDINGSWPHAAKYTGFGTTSRDGIVLDKRMKNANRYISKSSKDFFAFFDPKTLPPGVVK